MIISCPLSSLLKRWDYASNPVQTPFPFLEAIKELEGKASKILHFIWIGSELQNEEYLANITAWAQEAHEKNFQPLLWTDTVTERMMRFCQKEKVYLLKIEEFLSDSFFIGKEVYHQALKRLPSQFVLASDLLRYNLLRLGGLYLDVDMAIDELEEDLFLLYEKEPLLSIHSSNDVLGSYTGHPIWEALAKTATLRCSQTDQELLELEAISLNQFVPMGLKAMLFEEGRKTFYERCLFKHSDPIFLTMVKTGPCLTTEAYYYFPEMVWIKRHFKSKGTNWSAPAGFLNPPPLEERKRKERVIFSLLLDLKSDPSTLNLFSYEPYYLSHSKIAIRHLLSDLAEAISQSPDSFKNIESLITRSSLLYEPYLAFLTSHGLASNLSLSKTLFKLASFGLREPFSYLVEKEKLSFEMLSTIQGSVGHYKGYTLMTLLAENGSIPLYSYLKARFEAHPGFSSWAQEKVKGHNPLYFALKNAKGAFAELYLKDFPDALKESSFILDVVASASTANFYHAEAVLKSLSLVVKQEDSSQWKAIKTFLKDKIEHPRDRFNFLLECYKKLDD